MRTRSVPPAAAPDASSSGVLRLAQLCFLLTVLLVGWLRSPILIHGLEAYPVDFAFAATVLLWLIALARNEVTLRFHRAYWLLAAYFAAMALSVVGSADPQRSAFKLLTQLYLLSLPVIAFNLFRTMAELRRVFAWWLAGTAGVALLGVVTLLLFPLLGPDSILDWPLHPYGTIAPGPYPRLELTTQYPAMLANYLGASLMLLLIGSRLGWFDRRSSTAFAAAVLVSAFFTLTPGLGGILFMIGAWIWYWARDDRPRFARVALAVGLAMPLVAVLTAALTPLVYPSAPFLIDLPGLPLLAPAVRLLAWIDAAQTFFQAPLFGIGIGIDPVEVFMDTHFCDLRSSCVTDAHNLYLSIAAQAGIVGLAALFAIIWFVARQLKGPPPQSPSDVIVFGLVIAWLNSMALQGLVGSFEDARHLWLLLGLLLSAMCLRDAKAEQRTAVAGEADCPTADARQ